MPSKLKRAEKYFCFLIVIFFALCIGFYIYTENYYQGKIYPNVYAGNIDLGGKTIDEASELIASKTSLIYEDGIRFYLDTNSTLVYPIISFLDGESNKVLIDLKIDKTVDEVYGIGRSRNFLINLKDRFELLFLSRYEHNCLVFNLDEDGIKSNLRSSFYVHEPSDAFYYLGEDGKLLVESEHFGKKVDYDKAIKILKINLNNADFSSIQMPSMQGEPIIFKNDCLEVQNAVSQMINLAPITLLYEQKDWIVEKKDLLSWISFKKNPRSGSVEVFLEKRKIETFLKNTVTADININPIAPKFTIENGRVKEFKAGVSGVVLDISSVSDILTGIPISNVNSIDLTKSVLVVSDTPSEIEGELGIKEIIGQNSLSFAGSTVSRAKNIANAASALNGLLIAPGEEFSTIKNLLPIDGTNGYTKEIVINGGRTNYEYGGGVCHLSTTLFRTVLDSGLPVTMRKNHSYNMPYYYPAGTDASVYDPDPDFRFVNDTKNYVLIQAKIINSALVIELWGTNDGRIVTKGKSVVYNIVDSRVIKTIYTKTLPKGKTSCTYSGGYSGADAYFDYKVKYSDGSIKERRFTSHYIPRQGVCMVGV